MYGWGLGFGWGLGLAVLVFFLFVCGLVDFDLGIEERCKEKEERISKG